MRNQGHKALRVTNGKIETFDPHPAIYNVPDTPETLAEWIWAHYVGIPLTEPYDKEYIRLLDRIKSLNPEHK